MNYTQKQRYPEPYPHSLETCLEDGVEVVISAGVFQSNLRRGEGHNNHMPYIEKGIGGNVDPCPRMDSSEGNLQLATSSSRIQKLLASRSKPTPHMASTSS